MTALISLILFNFLIPIAALWANYCNNRTLRQRQMILNILGELPVESQWQNIWEQYNSVSYRQHLNCLLLFGNPWKLYKGKNNEQE